MKKILIGKDGFPVELVMNRPVLNFFRKIIHGKHYECKECYDNKQSCKNTNTVTTKN